jgi:predicted aminopeptidase
MRTVLRRLLAFVAAALAVVAVWAAWPGSKANYLAQQGLFQAELLYGRVPVEDVLASGTFDDEKERKLRLIGEVKAYGKEIGLSTSTNYDSINPTWDRTIWNVSACEPLKFESVSWWFPIVGRMPYLGYFREVDADVKTRELAGQGYDAYRRTAGAYSTLGWFSDPVLPQMLGWTDLSIADTVLHELTHATKWIPGSVQFNESFANFVGHEAAMRWWIARYGEDSDEVRTARDQDADRDRFSGMLRDTYKELDTLYRSDLEPNAKRNRKHAILAALPTRTAALGLHEPARYVRSVRSGVWNNARLVQFRTYNRSPEWFSAVLAQEGGDLRRFIARIDEITRGAADPYEALEAAAATPK